MTLPDPKEESEHPTRDAARDIAENQGLNAISVYGIIHHTGVEELNRPVLSLWWSGVAAGIGISTSVLAEGILHGIFQDHPYRPAIENLGYSVGFVMVILGRLQLFTENTLTAILPLLVHRNLRTLGATARLWGVILLANLLGTFLAMALCTWGAAITAEHLEGMIAISAHYGELTAGEAFRYGIPAGFLVASIVWMMPSARETGIFVIVLFTYLIAVGDFTHVVAGSAEIFLLLITGNMDVSHALPLGLSTLAGNIVGGTGLFALLAYGQISGELHEKRADGGRQRR